MKNHTKLAELQILNPDDTKQIRPVDAAALKLLDDPDDTHMYVNELMKSNKTDKMMRISGSPHLKTQATKKSIRHSNDEY